MNKTIRKDSKNSTIINEEGFKVYKRPIDVDLFLHSCAFRFKNSFYHSDKEIVEYLIDLIHKNDSNFVYALAYYLGKEIGLRLSPTIMTTELALSDSADWKKIEKIVNDIFTRPDFLANSCGYIKYKFNVKSFMEKLPEEFRKILKTRLENFNELTLKRRKMRRKEIKLSDLIKTLKPRPKNEEMSKLYKAIIENDKLASLKIEIENGEIQKAEHLTAAISSDKVLRNEKTKFIVENIDNIPINALLKNLSYLPETREAIKKLEVRLEDFFKFGNKRFINPFDLIMLEHDWKANNYDVIDEYSKFDLNGSLIVNELIQEVLNKILDKYIIPKFENIYQPTILYDYSGSMYGEPHRIGSKFITMITDLLRNDSNTRLLNFYLFNQRIVDYSSEIRTILRDCTAFNKRDFNYLQFAQKFYNRISPNGGTALLDAIKYALNTNSGTDFLVIVTDEATWTDSYYIEAYKRIIPQKLYGRTILFNACPGVGTVFKPSIDVIKVSGLNNVTLDIIKAMSNFTEFKNEIINNFNKILSL